MQVKAEVRGFDVLPKKLTAIEREAIPVSMSRALNRVTKTVHVQASRDVAKEMGLTVTTIKKALRIKKATPKHLVALIKTSGVPIGLIHFKARQIKKGVTAKAWGKRRLYKKTFIALAKTRDDNVPDGLRPTKEQVFVRKRGVGHLPIKKLYGPSIPKTLGDEAVMAGIHHVVRTTLPARFRHELAHRVTQIAARHNRY